MADRHLSAVPDTPAIPPQMQRVLDALEGVRPTGDQKWEAFCPAHDDRHSRSLSLRTGDVQPVVLYCHAGCTVYEVEAELKNKDSRVQITGGGVGAGRKPNARTGQKPREEPAQPLPNRAMVVGWNERLIGDIDARRYLHDRGITLETIRAHLIGWNGRSYTFPVFDHQDGIVNLRKYDRTAEPKMRGLTGRGSHLYPEEVLHREFATDIVVCEGELDALLLDQHGIPAVTGTAGAGTFKDEWAAKFKGKNVWTAYDCDKAGRSGSQIAAQALAKHAARVAVIDLGLPDEGADVTDWFVRYGRSVDDFTKLIVKAPEWKPSAKPKVAAKGKVRAETVDQLWPVMDPVAYRGLAGEVVEALEPHTEADPAALLLTYLTFFGSTAGLRPHMMADGAVHRARLYLLQVGDTFGAKKGSTFNRIVGVYREAAPKWVEEYIATGLSSAEGLISHLKQSIDGSQLVYEEEFARVLAVTKREANVLSHVLRQAFDREELRVMNKNQPLHVDNAHLSIVAHITTEELRQRLLDTDVFSGFTNRFLFALSKRSKLLPEGGALPGNELTLLGKKTLAAIRKARQIGEMGRNDQAKKLWNSLYYEMGERQNTGLFGAATARAAPLTLRLSMAYALLDGRAEINSRDLKAAWAVWSYCEASAAYVFGDSTGDPLADRILTALRDNPQGRLTRTQVNRLFSSNVRAARLDQAVNTLVERKLVRLRIQTTGGRPKVWVVLP